MNQPDPTDPTAASAAEFADAVRANQQQRASQLAGTFDYIVCGAGTSGTVVAARLAAGSNTRVLVLEAGGSEDTDAVHDAHRWPEALGSELDWGFVTVPSPLLNGRSIPYSMGKVLGGGSSINVSVWSRGHRADWDGYAAASGEPAWRYESVLDLYRTRIERWAGAPDPAYRGTHGAVHIQPPPNPHPFASAVLDAAASVGLTRYPNANGQMMEADNGCAPLDENVRDGRRQSVFRAYLYPHMAQPNVTVLTGALVTRILFDGLRATGVEFVRDGVTHRVEAACEVVLSLGAIHTPKLLMQSGIGDPGELRNAKVALRHALSGVGRNLHDHIAFGCIWGAPDGLPPVPPRSQTSCFWASRPEENDGPDIYAYSRRGSVSATVQNAQRFAIPDSAWSLVLGMRPQSRGTVRLSGPNPSDPVAIDTNYLGNPEDLERLLAGLRMAREIGQAAALRPFTKQEAMPGPLDAAGLESYFRDGISTFWHQSGTARMGRDALSVVDGRLRVHGIERLRIADASILPRVTAGNTMAPCIVIGEQAADFLRQDNAS
ncbi:GMC family oxidoreductase [Paraburkholderia solisilvae]|uniref:Oxygen-dependent choline dehydrogenase n=1 Tax=Paraburkholderia solisilvae TaxID=624376 RepID=A0A6J5EQ09_9BURK|nr:GMC family oxidoreductase N-terminal domain-containing protein [Paraburkholderia solisilvae]CAB3767095.1 Oxygen-dependent choline dehydrogenase [Paraburkholderia solisilvae]